MISEVSTHARREDIGIPEKVKLSRLNEILWYDACMPLANFFYINHKD